MIRIGEFSQLSRVPVKTLRFYDEIGLLKPTIVDQFTSYRYYTLDQLPRLHRILALKELGLSLDQIATLLNEDLSVEQIRGMLRLKQAELQQHIQGEQERLARVEARIRRIEMEGQMPTQEGVIKQTPSFRVLAYREMLPDTKAIPAFFEQVMGAVMMSNVPFSAPMLALYHHAAYRTVEMDTEIAIPVPNDYHREVRVDEQRVMSIRTIPAYDAVASMLHHGSYANIDDTYIALSRWIVERGYTIIGPAAEVYLRSMGDTQNPDELLTEIQFVVEKATANAS